MENKAFAVILLKNTSACDECALEKHKSNIFFDVFACNLHDTYF